MEKIRIRLQSFDNRLLDQSVKDIVTKAKRTGARIAGPIPLPTKIHRYCVLRSPHVDKKSREHFEMRIHKRLIDISEYNNDTIEELQKLDPGVEMVMPGDNVNLEISLITDVAMEKGLRFAIREGGRTVGAGSVTEILE